MTESVVRSTSCLNCGASLNGPFCAACGQRDIPPYPSTRELVVDAFWELSGWDGRFATTVKALVQRPGMLTREFLEGRRARYLSPLRLYLLASLAYFVLAAAAPSPRPLIKKPDVSTASESAKSRPERVADAVSGSFDNGSKKLTSEERAAALKDIERAPALMRPTLHKVVADPAGFKRGIVETMPRMLFALLPVFAAIVGIFYRRRKYPEHLYFAIHLHAFLFLALSLATIARFARVQAIVEAVGLLAVLWIPVYTTLAFRRAYGGSLAMTLAKEAAIGMIYLAVSVVALILAIYWVSIVS
ncbi:MAG: DUF3667 domain-containing protein [Gemmatimonadaceae bacterium]